MIDQGRAALGQQRQSQSQSPAPAPASKDPPLSSYVDATLQRMLEEKKAELQRVRPDDYRYGVLSQELRELQEELERRRPPAPPVPVPNQWRAKHRPYAAAGRVKNRRRSNMEEALYHPWYKEVHDLIVGRIEPKDGRPLRIPDIEDLVRKVMVWMSKKYVFVFGSLWLNGNLTTLFVQLFKRLLGVATYAGADKARDSVSTYLMPLLNQGRGSDAAKRRAMDERNKAWEKLLEALSPSPSRTPSPRSELEDDEDEEFLTHRTGQGRDGSGR